MVRAESLRGSSDIGTGAGKDLLSEGWKCPVLGACNFLGGASDRASGKGRLKTSSSGDGPEEVPPWALERFGRVWGPRSPPLRVYLGKGQETRFFPGVAFSQAWTLLMFLLSAGLRSLFCGEDLTGVSCSLCDKLSVRVWGYGLIVVYCVWFLPQFLSVSSNPWEVPAHLASTQHQHRWAAKIAFAITAIKVKEGKDWWLHWWLRRYRICLQYGKPGFEPWGWEDPLEKLLQYSCLENSMDRGAWRGNGPWGRTESDTTERLTHRQGKD